MMLDAFFNDAGAPFIACAAVARDRLVATPAEGGVPTPASTDVIVLQLLTGAWQPETVVERLVGQLADLPGEPLALVGHAEGAPLALAVAARLERTDRTAALSVFAACSPAPGTGSAPRVAAPISAIISDSGPVRPTEAFEWRRNTTGEFRVEVFPGNHCPLAGNQWEIADLIAEGLYAPTGAGDGRTGAKGR
ncbi:hypothetical protein UO65_0353 [Actinokineospora spheciospongiae]|uniref:Thioesterase domain-containing protein n=1 Tax=Actinokineospora spheciospongiae TaxID=909613 RepID=W7JEA5_9PSEU|nr:thioesterase domain-containing protein [Actinokineospora spheciospongiae]EWC64309.1 hypothetical protein UO65_0353 [Actinokineospora spheciospongiae]